MNRNKLNIKVLICSFVSMVRLDRKAVVVLVVVAGVIVLAAGVAAELTETWFEYRARTKKELKSRAKTSLDKHMGTNIYWWTFHVEKLK